MGPIITTLCLLVFAIVMFVWEKVSLAVISMMVCVALVVTGILDLKQAFADFIDSNVILLIAMLVVGGTLFETGMANKVGGMIIHFARTKKQLISTIVVVVSVMSDSLSNTDTVAVLVPVVIGVAVKSGSSHSHLLMPLVSAAALGGNLSLVGAPDNLIAQSTLQNTGSGFGFFEYTKVGLPMPVYGILYFLIIDYKFLPNNPNSGGMGSVDEQRDYSHVSRWKQILSLVVSIATTLGMIFGKQTGIDLAVVGCIGAPVLAVTGVLAEKQVYKAIDSQTISTFGGTLVLTKALEMTEADKLVTDQVIGLLGNNSSPFILLMMVPALPVVMTNLMSSIATIALLMSVSLSIVVGMGTDPRAVLTVTMIGSSCAYAMPIGMLANMTVLSVGGYKSVDYTRSGIPLIIVLTTVSLILLPTLFPSHPQLTDAVLTKEPL